MKRKKIAKQRKNTSKDPDETELVFQNKHKNQIRQTNHGYHIIYAYDITDLVK